MHSLRDQAPYPQYFESSHIFVQLSILEKDVRYSFPFTKDRLSAFLVKRLEKAIYKVEWSSSCYDNRGLRRSCPVWHRATLSNAVVVVKTAI
jgi:hypothetical protein